MSPIRKSGDFRAVQIDSWEEVVHDQLTQDMIDNDYTNLPDKGRPIKIWKTDVDPDNDLAFSRLKNAGVMPAWMELDKEVAELTNQLWAELERIEEEIRVEFARLSVHSQPNEDDMQTAQMGPIQRLLAWFRDDFSADTPPPPSLTSIIALRERERSRFLERAAALDKKIALYHDTLPRGTEHLQRLRWLPERSSRIFDERIDLSQWWNGETHER